MPMTAELTEPCPGSKVCRRLVSGLTEPPPVPLFPQRQLAGTILWLVWKTLSGSHRCFTSASRA